MVQAGRSAGDEAARSLRAAEEHRRKAAWHEERAARFARGRQGEVAAAQTLDALAADGYRRIDDCRWPGRAKANVDHVVIGPAGLFVIDAKNWSGTVEVRAGVLRQSGYRRSKEVGAVGEAAQAVGALVPFALPRTEGVIFLTGKAQLPVARLGNITVVSGSDIVGWIRSQPAVLRPDMVQTAYVALTSRLQVAHGGSSPQSSSTVPDYIPTQWPEGPVRHEPPARARRATSLSTQGGRRTAGSRFSRRVASVGRVMLVLLFLDAAVAAILTTNLRVGNLILAAVCAAWLVRLERRRPTLCADSTSQRGRRRR